MSHCDEEEENKGKKRKEKKKKGLHGLITKINVDVAKIGFKAM